jgi:hypothetical protein
MQSQWGLHVVRRRFHRVRDPLLQTSYKEMWFAGFKVEIDSRRQCEQVVRMFEDVVQEPFSPK